MANLQFQFSGKKVLVTGGAQGIGFEITKQFLQAGAQVTVWDYSEEAMQNALSELKDYSDNVSFHKVDVGQMASCQSAAEKIEGLHVLVNNAGITRDKSFKKMSTEEFETVIQTNLTGLFNVSKAVFERFDEQSGAKRIINMASVVALYGNFGQTNYVAAKAGVIGMTKTWAREFASKGFTVNAIAPGFIMTKMVQAMPQERLDAMAAGVPVKRLGQTEDIANACLFLSSDEASYINGTVISVDGGLVC